MKNLIIEQASDTPGINFNANGELYIYGVSIPKNISNFYPPILKWLNEFESFLPNKVTLVIEVEYINSSSVRLFSEIIKKVNSYKSSCPDTFIIWKCEEDDADIVELGQDLGLGANVSMTFLTQ